MPEDADGARAEGAVDGFPLVREVGFPGDGVERSAVFDFHGHLLVGVPYSSHISVLV